MSVLTGCPAEEDPASEPCLLDSDCGRGTICQEGQCAAVGCFTAADCPSLNQGCLTDGACTALECFSDSDCTSGACVESVCQSGSSGTNSGTNNSTGGPCATRADCPAGQICNALSGECSAPPRTCASDEDCPVGLSCGDDGACAPSANNGTNSGTNNSGTTSTNGGTSTTPTGDPVCAPCATDSDCGGANDKCTPLQDGSYCTKSCTTNADCATGFTCDRVSTASPLQCIPLGNRCEGCLLPDQACAAPQICDLDSRTCRTPANCGVCSDDSQCGPGGRCYSDEGQLRCGLPCPANNDCGPGFTCSNVRGADICVTTDACGESGACDNAPPCGGSLPYLNEEFCQCVECQGPADCAGLQECTQGGGCVCSEVGSCIVASQVCANGSDCAAPTPFCQGGFCVQCFGDQDCPNQGDRCIRSACQPCTCPQGQSCNSLGQCVDASLCTTDADCQTTDALGFPVAGRCSGGACYSPGSCGGGDPFNSTCPNGLTCEPSAIGFGFVCTNCIPLLGMCRAGETCVPDLLFGGPPTCAPFEL